MTIRMVISCEWCTETQEFVDEDPVDHGWLRLEGSDEDGEWWQKDFCGFSCLLSSL